MQTLPLRVRSSYSAPDLYFSGSPAEIEEALTIGALIQQTVITSRSQEDVQRMAAEKAAEIDRIRTGYQDRIQRIEAELTRVRLECEKLNEDLSERVAAAKRSERVICTKEAEEMNRKAESDREVLRARCEALESRRRTLEEQRAQDIAEATGRTEALMQRVVAAKEDQLVRMESAFVKIQEAMGRQTEEIGKLGMTLGKRAANVKTKGNDFESAFGERLRRYYGLCSGFEMRATGLNMTGHEADFAMDIEGHTVLWELKAYGSSVPKAEVDKFLRDVKENPQASVGVMISRTTDITGVKGAGGAGGGMHVEFEGDRMLIFLHRFEEFCEDDSRMFATLLTLFRVWWEYHRETDVFDRVEIIRDVEKAIEEMSKRRVEWRRHKAHLDELGRWAADLLADSEERLDRILKRAKTGSHGDAVVIEVPTGIFRDGDSERDRTWVQSIMSVCSAEEGATMQIRELVDLLQPHHKLSADTIRANVMSVLLDGAVVKKGIVKYVKGLVKRVEACAIRVAK